MRSSEDLRAKEAVRRQAFGFGPLVTIRLLRLLAAGRLFYNEVCFGGRLLPSSAQALRWRLWAKKACEGPRVFAANRHLKDVTASLELRQAKACLSKENAVWTLALRLRSGQL
jgi:hypothetical protein